MTKNLGLADCWADTTLESIISVASGKGLPKSKMVDGGVPVYGGNGVTGYHNEVNVIEPTIVIGRVGYYCGSVHFTPERAWVTDNAFVTTFSNENISRDFLLHLLEFTDLRQNVTSTAQPVISGAKLYPIKIHLPPLAEQKVIAEKLDKLLAKVDSIKACLDAVPDTLKRFRQSVLAAAVSGKLTEEWRGSSDLSEWKLIKLGNIVHQIEAGKNIKCIETPPQGDEHGIIKISAVTWGEYDEEQSKTLPDKGLFVESRRIAIGDFLISRANTIELLGNPVIVHKVTKNLMLSDKVLRLLMAESDKPWVSIFLRSMRGRFEIESRSTGNQMSMRNIGQKALLDIDLAKPPIKEQTEIVRRVEKLFAYADKIEAEVNAAQDRVNKLTQSILAKAFRGELTAKWREQNPELISGENSAEALLEKIKAEREKLKPKKKARARKKA